MHNPESNKPKSIVVKLVVTALLIYLFSTTVITSFHAYSEFQRTKSTIQQDLRGLCESFAPGLTHAIWGLDSLQIERTLAGIRKISVVTGIRLTNEEDQESYTMGLEEGYETDPFLLHETVPLVYEGGDVSKLKSIGTLSLYSDKQVVFDRVKLIILYIVLNEYNIQLYLHISFATENTVFSVAVLYGFYLEIMPRAGFYMKAKRKNSLSG